MWRVVCDLRSRRNLVNEDALAHWGLLRQKQTNKGFNLKSAPYLTSVIVFYIVLRKDRH
jgi:hypothetical protein